jgi:hypothetical protein
MGSDNIYPFKQGRNETEEAFQHRKELTERIYNAMLPLLGVEQTQKILAMLNKRINDPKRTLQPVLDQVCDLCNGPMKIDEVDKQNLQQSIVTCIECGYMDVLKK